MIIKLVNINLNLDMFLEQTVKKNRSCVVWVKVKEEEEGQEYDGWMRFKQLWGQHFTV